MKQYLIATPNFAKKTTEFMPSERKLQRLANYFQVFSDSTRLKIISCLSVGSSCVSDLSRLLSINQTTLSHQLKMLKSEGVVDFKRQGKLVVYSLTSPLIDQTMLSAVNFLAE